LAGRAPSYRSRLRDVIAAWRSIPRMSARTAVKNQASYVWDERTCCSADCLRPERSPDEVLASIGNRPRDLHGYAVSPRLGEVNGVPVEPGGIEAGRLEHQVVGIDGDG
jgi:hypothetical protein